MTNTYQMLYGGLRNQGLIKNSSNYEPLISIVTAVYNGERFFEQTIQSVLNQTYPNIEYIIIDGGSTDATVDIIKKYENKIDYWLSEPDKGIYCAWNKALHLVKGEWVCFIGADDFFIDDNVFENIIPFLNNANSKSIRYVYGKTVHISDKTGAVIEVSGSKWEDCKLKMKNSMVIPHSGAFHHSSLFEEHGFFDTDFQIAGDYEFLLREFLNPLKDAIFAEDVTVLKMRNGGISGNLDKRLILAKESNFARKKNNITSISWIILFWIIRVRVFIFIDKIIGRKFSEYIADCYRMFIGKKRRWSS